MSFILNPYSFVSVIPFPNTKSVLFDGVDDKINCGDVPEIEGLAEVTLSAWIKHGGTGSWDTCVWKNDVFGFMQWTNYNQMNFRLKTTNNTIDIQGSVGILDGDWHHLCGTYDGATVRIFEDGVEIGSGSSATGTIVATTTDLEFGGGFVGFWDGNIDEISIFDEEKSASDLYNLGAPGNLASESGLIFWNRQGDSAVFNANSQWEFPEQTKINNWSSHSFDFDGVNEYLATTTGAIIGIGNTFSVSCWVNADALVSYDAFCGSAISNSMVGGFGLITVSGNWRFFVGNYNAQYVDSSASAVTGSWVHLLGVYDNSLGSGNIEFYVNGVSQGTANRTTALEVGGVFEIGRIREDAYNLNGKIDGVSLWDEALTSGNVTSIFASGVPNDVSDLGISGLVAYYRMGEGADWNNTEWQVPDYSKNALFSQQSLDFDGTDDYISMGDVLNFEITDTISISAWINKPGSGYDFVVAKEIGGGDYKGYSIWCKNNKLAFLIVADLSNYIDVDTDATFTYDAWHHLLATYDGSGNASGVKLYIDGVASATTANVDTYTTGTVINAHPLQIGARNGGEVFDGYIDEASIWDEELTAGNVTSIYNSGVPSDLSTFSTKSFVFDGIDDGIDCGAVSEIEGLTTVTLSAWIKRPDAGSGAGWDMVCFKNPVLGFFQWGANNEMTFKTTTVTGGARYANSNTGIFDGNWHHICGTYDGATQKMFVDGVLANSTAFSGGVISASVNDFWIGIQDGSAIPWVGGIDEVSIFDEIKSASDLYNSGVPTDLSAESGLIGYWRMGEDALYNGATTEFSLPDNSTNSNAGTTNNMDLVDLVEDAPFSPLAYYRLGDSSTFNDGSKWEIPNYQKINNFSSHSFAFSVDDYVSIDGALTQLSGTRAGAISCWVKPTDATPSAQEFLLAFTDGDNANEGIMISILATGVLRVQFVDNSQTVQWRIDTDSVALSDGIWAYIAVVQNETLPIIYINSVAVAQTTQISTDTTLWFDGLTDADTGRIACRHIGSTNQDFFNGNIDGVSVWDRVITAGNISSIFNSGVPNDVRELSINGLAGYWRMGEGATWSSPRWSIPDDSEYSNNGVGNNMPIDAKKNNAPGNIEQGLSDSITQVDKKLLSPGNAASGQGANTEVTDVVNNAPDNINQGVSVGMDSTNIVEDVPT